MAASPRTENRPRGSTVFDPLDVEVYEPAFGSDVRKQARSLLERFDESATGDVFVDGHASPELDFGGGGFLMPYPDELIDEIRRLSNDVLDHGAEGGRHRALRALMEEAALVLGEEQAEQRSSRARFRAVQQRLDGLWWGLDDLLDSPTMGSLLRGWITGAVVALALILAVALTSTLPLF